jgi:hypothetical protein
LWLREWQAHLLWAAALLWLGYGYWTGRYSGFLVAAMAISGGVGAVELMGRYRQAPVRAVLSSSGFLFVAVNVGAAALAWYLLHVWHPASAPYTTKDKVTEMFSAGFGALVLLRAAVLKVRVSESDVGVGPAALLDSLLLIADRGVDRREGVARARDVTRLVARDPVTVANLLGKYSLALMQNVDDRTGAEMTGAVKAVLDDETIPPAIKMDLVALKIGVVVGSDVLQAAALTLNDRLTKLGPSEQTTPGLSDLTAQMRAARAAQPPKPQDP